MASLPFDDNVVPVVVKWHNKINQLLVGCSDGQMRILYDPKISRKGAVLAASRSGRVVDSLTVLLKSRAYRVCGTRWNR